jgi:hypothetical protein
MAAVESFDGLDDDETGVVHFPENSGAVREFANLRIHSDLDVRQLGFDWTTWPAFPERDNDSSHLRISISGIDDIHTRARVIQVRASYTK